MNKIFFFLKTFKSLIKIFLILNFKKKTKVLMFYFHVKAYQENIINLIKSLEKKNFFIVLAFNKETSKEIENKKNSFFIDFAYLKFIPFRNLFLKKINVFLSSYLTYVYPPFSKNIYISHDIYDAPMINKEKEKKMFIRINKLDYIFVASEISKKYFNFKLNKYNKKVNPKLIETGYLKLDHVFNKLHKKKSQNRILIAPAYSFNYVKYNMSQYLIKLLKMLIHKQKKKVIYRPHPLDLTIKGNQKLVKKVVVEFKNHKSFEIDQSVSYLESFRKAEYLITDITSTAYTFAFATQKPIIFYSNNEKNIKNDEYFNIFYFKDRSKVGYISKNLQDVSKDINRMISKKNNFKNDIINLRKKRIKYFLSSLSKTQNVLIKILNNIN